MQLDPFRDDGPHMAMRSDRPKRAGGQPRRAGLFALEGLTAALLLLYVGSTVLRPDNTTSRLFDTWIGNLAYGGSTLLCFWKAWASQRQRLAWLFIASALGVFTLGSVLWTSTIQFMDPVPYPSSADLCFLAFYPIAYIGIGLLIFDSFRQVFKGAFWLDGLIAALGVAALSASLVLGTVSRNTQGDVATVVTNLAYPIGDLLLVSLLVGYFALRGWHPGRLWWALGGGLALFAVADTIYVLRVSAGVYVTGTPLDGLWAIGAFVIALGAWHGGAHHPDRRMIASSMAVPAIFLTSSLAIVVFSAWHPVLALGLVLASATLIVSMGRVLYSYRQLQQLSESRREARTDDLTGLANRRMFYETLTARLESSGPDASMAVLLVDLNRFKEINDSLGHRVGDEILRQLGPRLASVLRPGDTLARLGGDEFGLLLSPPGDRSVACQVAERVHAVLKEPFPLAGVTLRVDASTGISIAPLHGTDADTLIQKADVAMYEAKRSQLAWTVYSPQRDIHTKQRLELVEDLRDAITNGQLVLYYQPKLDLRSGRIEGVEALVRWQHPTKGLLSPATFVDLAENTGLIGPLTINVLEQAVRQCADWSRRGLVPHVAVNLSAANLLDNELPDTLARLLREEGVSGSSLTLEITENSVMADPDRSLVVMDELRSIGCGLSVDDYGTGFSSLKYLRDLPVSELKLDRSFLLDSNDERAVSIIRSTVDLAHSLGLRMVAEGVEDDTTLELIRALGCDEAQGFHISRPVPADAVLPMLVEGSFTPPDDLARPVERVVES